MASQSPRRACGRRAVSCKHKIPSQNIPSKQGGKPLLLNSHIREFILRKSPGFTQIRGSNTQNSSGLHSPGRRLSASLLLLLSRIKKGCNKSTFFALRVSEQTRKPLSEQQNEESHQNTYHNITCLPDRWSVPGICSVPIRKEFKRLVSRIFKQQVFKQ